MLVATILNGSLTCPWRLPWRQVANARPAPWRLFHHADPLYGQEKRRVSHRTVFSSAVRDTLSAGVAVSRVPLHKVYGVENDLNLTFPVCIYYIYMSFL
jgi:hypothetical protein